MNFIRGRSFAGTYLIVDEAQNMTPNQIDTPFLDERTNGLSFASEYMKGSPLVYQVTMSTDECERSALALDAIRRLQTDTPG